MASANGTKNYETNKIQTVIQKVIIGIDTGSASGFIAILIVYADAYVEPILIDFANKTPQQWAAELDELIEPVRALAPVMAIVEDVKFMPMQGKGVFSFYRNIGQIEMYIAMRKIPAQWVSSRAWQKFYIKKAGTRRFTPQKEKTIIREMRKHGASEDVIANFIKEQKEAVKATNEQMKERYSRHRFHMRYRAAQLFPTIAVTDKNSQALLIAYTKLMEGKLTAVKEEDPDDPNLVAAENEMLEKKEQRKKKMNERKKTK